MTKSVETIIIGAGPAGMFAALHCEQKPVLLLEKNATAGKKLLIAGSGRCNITHDCEIKMFFDHYGKNARFLKPALLGFDNYQLISFFKEKGLNFFTDKNGKVFPNSENSSDVLRILLQSCAKNEVEIAYQKDVLDISKEDDTFIIKTDADVFTAHHLIIATGGKSYPHTGSTGSGYHFAKQLGHSILQPKPALTPIFNSTMNFAELAGVSLQNMLIYLYRSNKKIAEHHGDIVFTHKGVSGPGILDFSRYMETGDTIKLNFTGLESDIFRKLFIETSEKEGKATVQSFLKRFDIPKSLVQIILKEKNIDPLETLSNITKERRNAITGAFCEFPIEVARIGGFEMAMVTTGGVNLDEVNAKTMESKLVSRLFFVGEVLDIDGDTGGYNLQAAFSTGYLAAQTINKKHEKSKNQ